MLPDVGSTIVPPGLSRPSRSAASIIASPMRSFTEPPGFRYSSFARSSPGTSRASRSSRTIGRVPDELEDGRVLAARPCGRSLLRALSARAPRSRRSDRAWSRMACDSSAGRGRQPGSSLVHHHARASVVQRRRPSGWRPAPSRSRSSQRARCSSDRRKTIVLQVKPMSSHQRRAGTRKWTRSSAPSTSSPSLDHERERLTAARALRCRRCRLRGAPPGCREQSQAHVPVQVRPPERTRCGVGAKQNGFAIQTSVVPGKRTSA